VHGASGNTILAYNRAALRIANINVTGSMVSGSSGIVFYTDAPSAGSLAYVRVEDVDVSGFGQDGVQVGAWSGAAGFADVRIERAALHGNGRSGLLTFADRPNVHRDVYVGASQAYANTGIAGQSTNTGSGIVLGAVAGGVVERSVAHDNGALNAASEGPVGIWANDSTRIVIQHNESYGNRTGSTADGGGFDLDQNVTDSVVQYNYSHDNDGAGYLIAHRYATDGHRNNVIRFNISHDDGRRNGYAGIEVWGRTSNAAIYNNLVIMSPAPSGVPRAVRVWNAGVEGVRVQGVRLLNNILVTRGAAPLVEVSADQVAARGVSLIGNDYFAEATFTVRWGAASYGSLEAFRAAGQEVLGGTPTGLSLAPGFTGTTSAAAILGDAGRLETLTGYELTASSPLVDHGIDLHALAIDPGPSDFFGRPLAVADIGVAESAAAQSTAGAAPVPEIVIHAGVSPVMVGNWRVVSDVSAAEGARLENPDKGAPKVMAATASPVDYAELTFTAEAGRWYRLWIRGRAARNDYDNDSI
jgi:hypothetical protein